MNDLAPEAVLARLQGRFGRPYTFVASCPSTQGLLEPDAPEGAVVAADEQTEGRGRRGRPWYAPAGTSLLFSVALRPVAPPERLPELSPLAAHACVEAITDLTGLAAAVKYPNDVLVRGRKLAGILGEARDQRVVLGIGVNVNVPAGELPAAVETPATSLLVETGERVDRGELLARVLAALERHYDAWSV